MAYKILMATMGLDIGGAETHIVELSKQLKSVGHEVVIVSNGGVYVPEVEAAGIRHYSAPLHRRSVDCMRRSLAILRRVIREEKPDVVHAHARIPGFLCGLLKRELDFPFVTTCHGVYACGGVLRLLSDWGERTLAVSEDVRDYLREQYRIPEGNIALTINGIDTQKFSPDVSGGGIRREFGLGEATVVGHVSRLDRASSLAARQLIELAPRLDRAVPGACILITGGGEVYDELSARAREVNEVVGRPCVILTGPRTDINELVAACDLFVGVSRAALEAMAAGKPVVLSGAQGHTGLFLPELLQKAVDTNFCCRTDPTATGDTLLAEVISALELPAERREELGQYGRQVVLERYSVGRMTRDSLRMYEQVRRKKYNILMSGYYGFSNAGDDAILQSTHENLTQTSDEIAVTVLSNDPAQTGERYGLAAVPRFHLPGLHRAVKQCDVLLSGGGSLLQDRTSTRSLLYYLYVIRLARRCGKKVMLYANGIGPVTRPANRRRVKKVVEQVDLITLRDRASARELREMGVEREDLYITADPVFTMTAAPGERVDEILNAAGLAPGQAFAAVSIRDWPGTQEFLKQLALACDCLYKTRGLPCVFLLMQSSLDRGASMRVREMMHVPSMLLEQNLTPAELMGVIGKAKLCLAMRLHTLIFAARMAVPVVGMVYDPKVSSYLEELELPSAGHVSDLCAEDVSRCADALLADYDAVRTRLRLRAEELEQAARDNERLLMELLERE